MSKKSLLTHTIMIFIILIASFLLIPKVSQNDLFFDLKTGASLLKYGLDFKDHFSFIPNLTYIYHHYLYDLIIYKIYKTFNYSGIFYLFLSAYSLLGIIIYKFSYNYSNNKIISLFTSLITLYLLKNFYTNRIQSLTYILFFLELYSLNKLYNTGNKKYSIYLLIISLLIANLHMPLWIFTLILCLPFLTEILLTKIKFLKNNLKNKIIFTKPANSKLFIITFIILLLSGLCTPLKLYPYTFFLKVLGNNSYNFINEMKPTVLIQEPYILIIIGLTLIFLLFKTKIKFSDFALIIGLLAFSLLAKRNIAYLYLFSPLIFIKIFFENYNLPKYNLLAKYLNVNLLYLIIIFCLTICYLSIFKYYSNFNYSISKQYPVKIVNYLKTNIDYSNIHIYNDFNYGSFLAFNDIPVFIDSRAEVYMPEFNGGYDIISDYLNSLKYSKYKEVFTKYNFDYAIVYYNSNLYSYLKEDKDYKQIYNENNNYILFQKIVSN